MTTSQYISSKRMLAGIEILERMNAAEIQKIIEQRNSLEEEVQGLVRLMGETQFADSRLLLPMSRRVGAAAARLKLLESELAATKQKRLRHKHAREILESRIRILATQQQENELMDDVVARNSCSVVVQPATRHEA